MNREYTENYHSNPKVTHPEIKLDVPIPHEWSSLSYKNDICPSFGTKGLQIFVCDEQTKKDEGFEVKYSIIKEKDYGKGKDLFNTNNWDAVLKFVESYKEDKMTYYIRVRSEYVGYYTIEASNINDAEKIARERCRDELIGNGLDLHFDYDHIDEQETIDVMFDSDEKEE